MVKRKNKCCRHNRIQKPKVQNLEAKHTNFIGVFHIQETAQLELWTLTELKLKVQGTKCA